MKKVEMIYMESHLSEAERLAAIAKILARGYLRLLLSEHENHQDNLLKRLDN